MQLALNFKNRPPTSCPDKNYTRVSIGKSEGIDKLFEVPVTYKSLPTLLYINK